jgi:tetratricopeptide (TPR) repeat protein
MRRMIAALENQQPAAQRAERPVQTPQSAGSYLDRGILCAGRGEFDKASADFTEALRLDRNMASAYLLRGRALYASVSQVYSVSDNFSGVGTMSTGGKATAEQSRVFDRAIADFSEAIRLDSRNSVAYWERGTAYADKGEPDKGIADYDQAIKINPNYAAAYNSRGIAHYDKRNYDQAIADYNQAIKLSPNYASAYSNRGIAYKNKGNQDQAIADYTQAIKLDPNYASVYNNRGNVY